MDKFIPERNSEALQICGRDKQDFSVLQLAHAFDPPWRGGTLACQGTAFSPKQREL
jgi:hypothetical protein